ncbi:GNAT family N-acetyltransferase [Halostella sp. PRR32]|uniref:GNAT family N-acetyltransferase n=1 Tax=Halostella sp. PRR32 TaxID=3098147 RepID=UPI00110D42ED|nr:GNAT family protein [Halostella sp. PRR32]
MPGATFLAGDRVDLRTVEEDDLEFLRDHSNDPAIRRPMTFDTPTNLEQQRDRFDDMYADDDAGFLACVDGDPVGYVMLFHVDDSAGHAEIAYWTTPDAQGDGYTTEAVALLVDYAFDERRLHRLRARALESNAASRGLLEKLGFTEEGVQRDETFVSGEYVDTHFYGLLESEWDGVRPSRERSESGEERSESADGEAV